MKGDREERRGGKKREGGEEVGICRGKRIIIGWESGDDQKWTRGTANSGRAGGWSKREGFRVKKRNERSVNEKRTRKWGRRERSR